MLGMPSQFTLYIHSTIIRVVETEGSMAGMGTSVVIVNMGMGLGLEGHMLNRMDTHSRLTLTNLLDNFRRTQR